MQNKREKEDEFLKDIRRSLAEQVKEEMEHDGMRERKVRREPPRSRKKRKKKKGLWLKIFLILITLLLVSGAFLTLTPMGRKILTRIAIEYIYSRMDEQPKKKKVVPKKGTESRVEEQEEELVKEEITENIDLSAMSDTFKNALHEEGVYNILLLGVESVYDKVDAHGRTDSIMVATINTKKKTLGLTSLMRDSYVEIPGHEGNRINTAYALGGKTLMYETIAKNYGVRLDGSVIVGFDAFQEVIDDLGGVEIDITEGEAQYLNTTNYISKKKNRTLKPGKNLMNGNQALGYARVRYEKAIDGSMDDFGRTSRHRRIMGAIFEKMKKANPASLVRIMNTVIPKVKTDISKSNASSYLAELLELSLDGVPLDTLRLPENGAFYKLKVKRAIMVGIDWEKTKPSFIDFVFSEHKKPEDKKEEKAQEGNKDKK